MSGRSRQRTTLESSSQSGFGVGGGDRGVGPRCRTPLDATRERSRGRSCRCSATSSIFLSSLESCISRGHATTGLTPVGSPLESGETAHGWHRSFGDGFGRGWMESLLYEHATGFHSGCSSGTASRGRRRSRQSQTEAVRSPTEGGVCAVAFLSGSVETLWEESCSMVCMESTSGCRGLLGIGDAIGSVAGTESHMSILELDWSFSHPEQPEVWRYPVV
jgi:hypothetical protein